VLVIFKAFSKNHFTNGPLLLMWGIQVEERLNTHARVAEALQMLPRVQNDLDIWTVGVNFNTRENIVLKANYQFRNNRYTGPLVTTESDVVEFGIGFIF
jgi:hypothetical protein